MNDIWIAKQSKPLSGRLYLTAYEFIIVLLYFRAVHILPNRFIGVVGEHPGDFPIENLSLSRDSRLLASCSHDHKIKFWNIDSIKSEKVNTRQKAGKGNKTKFLKSSEKGDFFADLAADENAAGTSTTGGEGDNSDDDEDSENDDSD